VNGKVICSHFQAACLLAEASGQACQRSGVGRLALKLCAFPINFHERVDQGNRKPNCAAGSKPGGTRDVGGIGEARCEKTLPVQRVHRLLACAWLLLLLVGPRCEDIEGRILDLHCSRGGIR